MSQYWPRYSYSLLCMYTYEILYVCAQVLKVRLLAYDYLFMDRAVLYEIRSIAQGAPFPLAKDSTKA